MSRSGSSANGARAGQVYRLAADRQLRGGQQFGVARGEPRFFLQIRLDGGIEGGDVGFPQPQRVTADQACETGSIRIRQQPAFQRDFQIRGLGRQRVGVVRAACAAASVVS